jgi:hypothetical protein
MEKLKTLLDLILKSFQLCSNLLTIQLITTRRQSATIEVTYEIRVFLKGAQKEVFSSILKKSL